MTIDDLAQKMDELSDNLRDSTVLSEQMKEDNRAILEGITGIRKALAKVPKREEFNELANDVKTIKAAVTAQQHDLNDHDQRIMGLEEVAGIGGASSELAS